MVLQKANIDFIGHRGQRDQAYRRHRVGWLLGFLLTNLAPPFSFVALLGLAPNVVAGVAGANVAFTSLFSALILRESLGRRSLFAGGVLLFAIVLAGLRGSGSRGPGSAGLAALCFALPLALGLLGLLVRRRRRGPGLAVLLGALAGSLGGYMLLPLAFLGGLGPRPLDWLLSPWLWLYLACGLGSLALLQLAYKDGAMNRVGPAYYGLQVLWPALASIPVFGLPVDGLQLLAFALIGLCVVVVAGAGGEGETRVGEAPDRAGQDRAD
jgi:drug/metabolite transporter (DMT)-like permease